MLHLAHTFCAVSVNEVAMVGGMRVVRSAAAAGFLTMPVRSGWATNGCELAAANGKPAVGKYARGKTFAPFTRL